MRYEVYENMQSQLHPSEKSVNELIKQCNCSNRTFSASHRVKVVKTILASAAVLAVGFTGMRVASSNSSEFRDMLYEISPRAGALFSPVMMSDVQEGIEMTVEGVYIDGDDAEFYITFQDLEGERVRTVDLCDSYRIRRTMPFSFDMSSFGCAGMPYDEMEQKKRFQIFSHEPGVELWGDCLTFYVQEIICDVDVQENTKVPIDLSEIEYYPMTQPGETLPITGWGINDIEGDFDPDAMDYLVPSESKMLAEGIEVSGVAWKEGFLHIQVRGKEEEWNDATRISLWLADENGARLEGNNVFWNLNGYCYMELLYRLNPEDVEKYQVYGDIWSGGTRIAGNWKVKFPLKDMRAKVDDE